MRLHLLNNGFDLSASQDEKYDFVISIAEGKIDIEEIKEWIEEKVKLNEG